MRHPFARIALATSLGLSVIACSDSTGSGSKSTVTVSAVAHGTVSETPGGMPALNCEVGLSARVNGSSRDTVRWLGGTFRYFIGAGGTTPTDSASIPGTDVMYSWNPRTLVGGGTATAGWAFTAGIPFAGEFVFRYSLGGRDRVTEPARFVCGAAPAGAGPPAITSVTVEQDDLEPGGLMLVRYQASGPAGLWATAIHVDGAFTADTIISEGYSPSPNRYLEIRVPKSATLGMRPQVHVSTVDVTGATAEHAAVAGPLIVDRTPPTLLGASLTYPGVWTTYVGSGDRLSLQYQAVENGVVRRVVYELGGPLSYRDSVDVQPDGSVPIQLRLDRTGSTYVTVWLRDAAGNASASVVAGRVDVYPTRSYPMRSAAFAGLPADVTRSAGGAAYLAMGDRGVLRLPIASLAATQVSPARADRVDLSPTGDRLWYGSFTEARLRWLDPANPASGGTLTLPGKVLGGVRALSNGKLIAATVADLAENRIVLADPASGDVATLYESSGGLMSESIALGAAWDGSRVLVHSHSGCARVYDVATAALAPCHGMGGGSLSASRDGSRFLRGGVAVDATGVVVPPSGEDFFSSTVITPDGESLYLYEGGDVLRFALSNRQRPLERFVLPGGHAGSFQGLLHFVDEHHLLVFTGSQVHVVELP